MLGVGWVCSEGAGDCACPFAAGIARHVVAAIAAAKGRQMVRIILLHYAAVVLRRAAVPPHLIGSSPDPTAPRGSRSTQFAGCGMSRSMPRVGRGWFALAHAHGTRRRLRSGG